MSARYEFQDENGNTVSADSTDCAIVIDHVAGLAFDVRAIHIGDHASCERYAADSTLAGHKWMLPGVNTLVAHVVDRKRVEPALAEPFVAKLKDAHWRLWTSEGYAADNPARPVYAWVVYCQDGLAGIDYRDDDGLALPVSPLAVTNKDMK